MQSPIRAYKIRQFKKQFRKCQKAQAAALDAAEYEMFIEESSELYIQQPRRGIEIERPPSERNITRYKNNNNDPKIVGVYPTHNDRKLEWNDSGKHLTDMESATLRQKRDGIIATATSLLSHAERVNFNALPHRIQNRANLIAPAKQIPNTHAQSAPTSPQHLSPEANRSASQGGNERTGHITFNAPPTRERSRTPEEILQRNPEVRGGMWGSFSTASDGEEEEEENLGLRLMMM